MANIGYLQVARRCNQKCIFCSNPDNGRILTLEEACAHIDDFVERKYDGVILTGGEPTLFEPLPELVEYATGKGIKVRMITNGQRTADIDFLKRLASAGLQHMHISIHSNRAELHDWLTQTPGSLEKQAASLRNAGKLGLTINVNIVINHYNADHLHEVVEWVVMTQPAVNHFIFNNLDPLMRRSDAEDAVIPKLREFEISLWKAGHYLENAGRSFRVERVPLCYMTDFAHYSTETRKIVKEEERLIHFLDQKETFQQQNFYHHKADICNICTLNPICAGLYELGRFYDPAELSPLFINPKTVVDAVLGHSLPDDQYAHLMERISLHMHPGDWNSPGDGNK